MEWLEKSEQSDRYVFPLYISFQGEEDKATEMFVQETLFEVLQQSRGLSQEQFLQIWPKLERSDGPEMVRSEGVERREQVGIAIGISYAGPNRTRKLPSRILEDEDFWLGEIPRTLSLKIREGISPRRRTAAGEWMPGVVAVYFYDADDRAETPPAMVANLTKSDLFLAFISRKYLHSPYCMVEIFEVFRNHNRKLPNGKVFIVDLMSIPNGGAQPMNYRRRQFQVPDWMEYWKKKWKAWFKVADYFATKRLANNSLATGGGGLNAQRAGNFLPDRNTSYELDRIRTNCLEGRHSAYATWKDAIRSDEPNPILADLGKQIRDNSTGSQVVIPVGVFDMKDPQARAEINGQVAKLFNEVKRLIERQISESSE
jgi:hypothetical protein